MVHEVRRRCRRRRFLVWIWHAIYYLLFSRCARAKCIFCVRLFASKWIINNDGASSGVWRRTQWRWRRSHSSFDIIIRSSFIHTQFDWHMSTTDNARQWKLGCDGSYGHCVNQGHKSFVRMPSCIHLIDATTNGGACQMLAFTFHSSAVLTKVQSDGFRHRNCNYSNSYVIAQSTPTQPHRWW